MIAHITKVFGKVTNESGQYWIKVPIDNPELYEAEEGSSWVYSAKSIFEEGDLAEGTAVIVERNNFGELEITGVIN
jgi:hypothetical protein